MCVLLRRRNQSRSELIFSFYSGDTRDYRGAQGSKVLSASILRTDRATPCRPDSACRVRTALLPRTSLHPASIPVSLESIRRLAAPKLAARAAGKGSSTTGFADARPHGGAPRQEPPGSSWPSSRRVQGIRQGDPPAAPRRPSRRPAGSSSPRQQWTARQRQASRLHEISYRACFKPQLPRFSSSG